MRFFLLDYATCLGVVTFYKMTFVLHSGHGSEASISHAFFGHLLICFKINFFEIIISFRVK